MSLWAIQNMAGRKIALRRGVLSEAGQPIPRSQSAHSAIGIATARLPWRRSLDEIHHIILKRFPASKGLHHSVRRKSAMGSWSGGARTTSPDDVPRGIRWP